MYSREEIKQLHKDFWNGFDEFCAQLPRFKYRRKPWILYNTKIKGVELKFDATREGAYVIFELNHHNTAKRFAMMDLMKKYKVVFDEYFDNAIWEDSFIKPCGTDVCRIYRRNPDLNIHKKEHWKDFYVYLSKNMSMLEKSFDQLRELLEIIAENNAIM